MSEQKTISKLFENKFVVHIVCEMVAFLGLIFYISGKNKKLVAHIEQLNQRLEAQDTLIQKLDGFCQQLSPLIGKLNERVYALENSPLTDARVLPAKKGDFIPKRPSKPTKPENKPVAASVAPKTEIRPASHSLKSPPLATIEEIMNEVDEPEPHHEVEQEHPLSGGRQQEHQTSENNESSETAEESDGELDRDLSEELEELNESTSLKKTP